MLPAIRGILPRVQMERSTGGAPTLRISRNASGNMPDRASRMLALPDQRRCVLFQLRMLMILLCAFFPLIAFGQSDDEFAKANQEYAQGHFKEAIAGYEALVHGGQWNANLFYDLGNAYFRTRDFGRAILNYERALALDPSQAEARANLQLVRDQARALELAKSWPEQHLGFLSTNQYAWLGAIAFWCGTFILGALSFARRRPVVWIFALLLLGVICGASISAIHTI